MKKQTTGYQGWIDVKDDLPDPESMDYVWSSWVSDHGGKQIQYQGRSRYWAAKGWRHEGWAEWHQDVTHWMPMPEMPNIEGLNKGDRNE